MSYILLLLTAIWPVGQLAAIAISDNIRFNLLDLVVALAVLQTFLSRKPVLTKLSKSLLFTLATFVLTAIISKLWFGNLGLPSFLYLIRFCLYGLLFFYLQVEKERDLKKAAVLSLSIFCFLGLIQYLFLPDVRSLKFVGFDDHYYRLIGTFLDPNYSSLIFVITIFITLSLPNKKSFLSLVPLALLALTFSRAGYLTFAFGLVVFIFTKRDYKLFFLLFVLALAVYLVPKPFGEGVNLFRSFSITSRFNNQLSAIDSFKTSPVFGHGFNHYKETAKSQAINLASGVDNSFLFVGETTGLIGLIPFLYFIFLSLKSVRGTGQVVLASILFHSLFNNSFFYSWIFVTWLMTLRLYQIKD